MFYQLFTIFVSYEDATFPVFYALMSRKTRDLYNAILMKIRSLLPDFKPVCVMADFEEASAAAFIDVFGKNITISGCWFHYAQAVSKRVQKIGLKE
jgi:MULE transposase domain